MPRPSALALIRHDGRRRRGRLHWNRTPALHHSPVIQHRPSPWGCSLSVSLVRGPTCLPLRGLPGRRRLRTGSRSRSAMARSMRPSSSCNLAMMSSRSMDSSFISRQIHVSTSTGRGPDPANAVRLAPTPVERRTLPASKKTRSVKLKFPNNLIRIIREKR